MTSGQPAHRHNTIQTSRYFRECLIIIKKIFLLNPEIHRYSKRITSMPLRQFFWAPTLNPAALELHIAAFSCIRPLKRYLLLSHKLGKTINEPLKPPQYNMIFHVIVFLVFNCFRMIKNISEVNCTRWASIQENLSSEFDQVRLNPALSAKETS